MTCPASPSRPLGLAKQPLKHGKNRADRPFGFEVVGEPRHLAYLADKLASVDPSHLTRRTIKGAPHRPKLRVHQCFGVFNLADGQTIAQFLKHS
jgi:hypothetical protein